MDGSPRARWSAGTCVAGVVLLLVGASAGPPELGRTVPAPLFTDPNYRGACDPEIVWNEHAREFRIFYTARRALRERATNVGTPIGVAASKDLATWRFLGYCAFDGVPGKPDNADTRWAPGILRDGRAFHMFVTSKDNADPPWGGDGVIVHYEAPADDLLSGWKRSGVPAFAGPDPIDVALLKTDEDVRAYYRVGRGGGIQWSSAPSLAGDPAPSWINQGKCPGDVNRREVHGLNYQEAPYVFRFAGSYWMLTDPHDGLAVYRSIDAVTWALDGRILKEPGQRPEDGTLARHPSVAVVGDRAFLFYHVEPNRPYPSPPAEERTVEQKLSFLQIAELRIQDGHLTCDRDREIALPLE